MTGFYLQSDYVFPASTDFQKVSVLCDGTVLAPVMQGDTLCDWVVVGRCVAVDAKYKQQDSKPPKREKPLLGVVPQQIWREIRYGDLLSAIDRYKEAGLIALPEWCEELSDLAFVIALDENSD